MRQFSLKTLMIAVLVTAVLCCLFFTLPSSISAIALLILTALAAPAVVAGIVYGGGNVRAFAIGCAPPVGLVVFSVLRPFFLFNAFDGSEDLIMKLAFVGFAVVVGLSGLVSVGVRKWTLRQNSRVARDDP